MLYAVGTHIDLRKKPLKKEDFKPRIVFIISEPSSYRLPVRRAALVI